jgi:drug/metabolite transporter (DMT)-like permease
LTDEKTPYASRLLVVGSLLAVYLIWGSTYLAIRFGIEGFPPLLLNGIRFLLAGGILYGLLRARRVANPSRRQVWNAGRVGLLLLIGGVGFVTFAEQAGVGSGLAATAVAVMPVWAALISGLFGLWPRRTEWIGLGIGLAGVLVLVQEGDFKTSVLGMTLMVVSPMIWAFGSIWAKRLEMADPLMTTAVELLAAGAVMIVVGLGVGERIVGTPSASSWMALLYLSIFGSLIAFTAYVYLLNNVRPALATSYAYVNPVVAVILGIWVGHEIITGPIFLALPLILIGIALVAAAQRGGAHQTSRPRSALLAEEEAA